MELELDIFYHTEDTTAREKRGETVLMTDYKVVTMTFYSIDWISPWHDVDEVQYTRIGSGGECFICIMDYEQTKEKIKQAK